MEKTSQTHSPKLSRSEAAKLAQSELATNAVAVKQSVQAVVRRAKPGQPTKFSPEKWEKVLETIATYGDLIEACSGDDMPAVSTIYKWIRDDPVLKDDIRDAWEMFSMIGHSVNNNILRGGELSTGDFRRDEALAAQNRWHMSKTNRRDFGDKQTVDVVHHQPVILDANVIQGELGDGV